MQSQRITESGNPVLMRAIFQTTAEITDSRIENMHFSCKTNSHTHMKTIRSIALKEIQGTIQKF